jgi:hypothetical protein
VQLFGQTQPVAAVMSAPGRRSRFDALDTDRFDGATLCGADHARNGQTDLESLV